MAEGAGLPTVAGPSGGNRGGCEAPPLFSVVINTYNRASSLPATLEGLRYLNYPNLEVVVVNGPSTDGTEELLRGWAGRVKHERCTERNLSVSRNVGIRAAAGEYVAFIDDDAIPEPEWVDQLLAGYDAPDVGATGGVVYDHTGYTFQYEYSTASRLGNADWNVKEHAEYMCFPGSFTFPYLQGTNTSFRRTALVAIGGFDEEYEYYLDETDVCLRMIDAGYVVKQLANAFVHHKFAPSELRDHQRVLRNRYPVIKNKIYFSFRNARPHCRVQEIIQDNLRFIAYHQADVEFHIAGGRLTARDQRQYEADVDQAWVRALAAAQAERRLFGKAEAPPAPVGFPCVRPAGDRLTICFLSQDYPPTHVGGIGRFTAELAAALARAGHNVHVLTRGIGHHRVDFESGTWVHRLVPQPHELTPEAAALSVPQHIWDYSATMLDEVARISTHRSVDLVEAPIWDAEGIAILLHGSVPLVTSLHTTLTIALESHAEWANDATFMRDFGQPMTAIEALLVERSAGIHSNSEAITRRVEDDFGLRIGDERLGIVPHGLENRPVPEVLAAEEPSLLFVGRLEKRKGVEELLAVAPRLLARYPDLVITLVGDDTLRNDRGRTYREEFEGAHPELEGRVRFLGKVDEDELYRQYARCSVFAAPSHFESFGLIFLEAMRFGKPVVGCVAGGIPEVVCDGAEGLLAQPADAESLHACLDRLLGDAQLRERLGRAGRARFESTFTAERMARDAERFYRRLVAAHAAHASRDA